MRALGMQFPEISGKSREIRPHDYGMANALAKKVRRESPSDTIDYVAAEYGLTYGEAKGAVYGTASRATIDKALKRGGWALAVELITDLLGEPLEHFIERQAMEARRERIEWEARERAAKARAAALAELGFGGRRNADPNRTGGPDHA
jgi:hypothetical protein